MQFACFIEARDTPTSYLKEVTNHDIPIMPRGAIQDLVNSPNPNGQWVKNAKNNHDHHLHSMHDHNKTPSHLNIMDPSLNVFFMIEDLKIKKKIPIYFPNRNLSSSPFLPKEEADSIPFASTQLPLLMQRFSFKLNSPQAQAMEDTLKECESRPIEGETKRCATSLESMLDFAGAIFGKGAQFQVLRTIHYGKPTPTSQSPVLQNYTIMEVPQEIFNTEMVACHTMPYPYVVFYCHHQVSISKVFKVSLEGEDGDTVEAIAVCHMDTSAWSPDHVSFLVLKSEPGSAPVCHFFPEDHLVLVPYLASV